MIRSTLRISALIVTESSSASNCMSRVGTVPPISKSEAHRLIRPITSKSTGSRTATSASKRLTSRRSSSKRSNRSSCATSSSELRATSGSKELRCTWITSDAIRSVVKGVRSSWVTSETKRCWTRERCSRRVICSSIESAISL